MRFLIRKRRTAPAVIIVALIDVLIVLVIFLLVTTTFKQQPALKLALPASTAALKSGANENPPQIVYIDDQTCSATGRPPKWSPPTSCAAGSSWMRKKSAPPARSPCSPSARTRTPIGSASCR